jgi:hypothetical protein
MTESGQAAGVGQLWSQPQHAVAYQEARAVLNAQQQRKSNLEDKALRTTRLTTIVVGALITVVKAFSLTVAGVASYFGVGFLVAAFVTSLAAYSVEGPTLGPNTDELRHLVKTNTEDWEKNFLSLMGKWMRENTRRIERSSVLLLVSDIALIGGVVTSLSAVVV